MRDQRPRKNQKKDDNGPKDDHRYEIDIVQVRERGASHDWKQERQRKQRSEKKETASDQKREKKVPIALLSKLAPRLHDCCAILNDAIDEYEATARPQPRKHNRDRDNQNDSKCGADNNNPEWNLVERITEFLGKLGAVAVIVIVIKTGPEVRQERGKAHYQPFLQFERLKENSLHQLERFAEWLEDFDLRLRSVHPAI